MDGKDLRVKASTSASASFPDSKIIPVALHEVSPNQPVSHSPPSPLAMREQPVATHVRDPNWQESTPGNVASPGGHGGPGLEHAGFALRLELLDIELLAPVAYFLDVAKVGV